MPINLAAQMKWTISLKSTDYLLNKLYLQFKNLPTKRTPSLDGLSGELYPTVMEEIIEILPEN